MATDSISVQVKGTGNVIRTLLAAPAKVDQAMRRAGTDVGLLVKRESARRAPYRLGDLERSIDYDVQNNGDVEISVPLNSPAGQYAYRMHEGVYRLGPGSVAKQGVFSVGRKYISRAITANGSKILATYAKVFDRIE
jgi:hypothetical protein